jgi:hypothetical protein
LVAEVGTSALVGAAALRTPPTDLRVWRLSADGASPRRQRPLTPLVMLLEFISVRFVGLGAARRVPTERCAELFL